MNRFYNLILLLLLTFGIPSLASKDVVGIKCGNKIQLLSTFEGNFYYNENNTANTKNLQIHNLFKGKNQSIKKATFYLNSLTDTSFSTINKKPDPKDLVFDIPPQCELFFFARYIDGNTVISEKHLKYLNIAQLSLLNFELALNYLSDEHSPVGVRSLSYKMAQSKIDFDDHKALAEAYSYAGFRYYEHKNVFLDLAREVSFSNKRQIISAYPKPKSSIFVKSNKCSIKETEKVIYDRYHNVYVILNKDCKIQLEGFKYTALRDTAFSVNLYGELDSIYIPIGSRFESRHYQLTAVGQPGKINSKIYFRKNKVLIYLGVEGYVDFQGIRQNINPTTNVGFYFDTDKPTHFVLQNPFNYKTTSLNLKAGNEINLYSNHTPSMLSIVGTDSEIYIQGQWIPILNSSKIHFSKKGYPSVFVPSTKINLSDLHGKPISFHPGKRVELCDNGLVCLGNSLTQ